MARLKRHLTQAATFTVATMVAIVPTATVEVARAEGPAPVEFFTPRAGETVPTGGSSVHIMLGAQSTVRSVKLQYRPQGGSTWVDLGGVLSRPQGSDVFDTTTVLPGSGSVELRATGFSSSDAADGTEVGSPAEETVKAVAGATRFTFVRPAKGEALGVFRRADGHSFVRASGITTRAEDPVADAPAVGAVAPSPSALPAPTGTFKNDKDGWTYRKPVEVTGIPGLAANRAVIRVRDSVSSAAAETTLYNQAVRSVTAWTTPVPGTANVTVTAKVSDQYGQVVVGAPVRLRGFVNGSRTPVAQVAVSDAHDGLVTFTNGGAGFPAGWYVPYVDLNLNGFQTTGEPGGPQLVVGTVARTAPGHSLYHNNARKRGGSGTVGDSLAGTRAAAARRFQWIDQDGQLAFSTRAVKQAGVGRVSVPTHLTWVNAHGAPFNPRWMKKGRFETRAWNVIRKRRGLRNADMTFQHNAAYRLSVEWEVKDIRPFTSPAALNAAFASLAASARRAYGANWQSRVQVKMLSNLSGGQPFALKVLRYAHAHGFTTILLARGAATRTPIPAAAHAYVDYVRGAQSGLYPNP